MDALDEILSSDIDAVLAKAYAAFSSGERFYLFGASKFGRHVLRGLRKIGVSPLAFLDNNPALHGKDVDGLAVIDPKTASFRSAPVVVTIFSFPEPMAQARALGFQTVMPTLALFWRYARAFLPYYYLDLPHMTVREAPNVREAFGLLADDASRREYLAQLRWRLLMDFKALPPSVDDMYFPPDLFKLGESEVFVDVGAYDGDTIADFLDRTDRNFRAIHAFEPDPANYERLLANVDEFFSGVKCRITTSPYALSNWYGDMKFDASGDMAARFADDGAIVVPVLPLDRTSASFEPSFIKIDAEGAECDILMGAKETIRAYRPILAVCAYHRHDDLWAIPMLIKKIEPSYKIHLRRHSAGGTDLVCYAIPPKRTLP